MSRIGKRGYLCFALALLVAISSSAGAAIVVTDAFYRADLTYPTAQHLFAPGSISVDEDWFTGGGAYRGHVTATAGTTDGLLPTAAVSVSVSGTGLAAIDGDGYAWLTYYWAVEQIAGAARSTVPVEIHVVGTTSAAEAGDAGTDPHYAEAFFNFIGSTSSFVAGVKPGATSLGDSFDRTFTKTVSVGTQYSVSLTAYGLATAGWNDGPGTARVDAMVDPLIVIDPTFVRAGDFRVVFSPGVPEPGTLSLLALAGLGIIRRRRA